MSYLVYIKIILQIKNINKNTENNNYNCVINNLVMAIFKLIHQ